VYLREGRDLRCVDGGGFVKQADDNDRLAVYRVLMRAGEQDSPPLAALRQRGVKEVVAQFIMSVLYLNWHGVR